MSTLRTIIPEIKFAPKDYDFSKRVYWTIFVLALYMIMFSIPLYDIGIIQRSADPFSHLRTITPSYGSYIELGVLALIGSWSIMYVKTLLTPHVDRIEDIEDYLGWYKLIAILLNGIIALIFIVAGVFGTNLTFGDIGRITIQLLLAGILLIYLDDLLRKGWGLGNGISIFILGTFVLGLFWNLFSVNINAFDIYPLGAITAFLTQIAKVGPLEAVNQIFFRPGFPTNSLLSVVFTGLVILIIMKIYESKTAEPIVQDNVDDNFQHLLVNTIATPIFLTYLLLASINVFALLLWSITEFDSGNLLVVIIGQFQIDPLTNQITPVGGLAYFITPIHGFYALDSSFIVSTLPRMLIFAGVFYILSTYLATRLFKLSPGFEVDLTRDNEHGIDQHLVLQQYALTKKSLLNQLIIITIFAELIGIPGGGINLVIIILLGYSYVQYRPERTTNRSRSVLTLLILIGLAGFTAKILMDTIFGGRLI